LIPQIDTSEPVILVGISFGGVIAQELSKLIRCRNVIIISSIKSPKEFSIPLSLVRWTKIHLLIPPKLLKWSNHATADYYFSTQSEAESTLLHQIIEDTDSQFSVWAIRQLMQWKPSEILFPLVHIHGEKDRIFPIYPIRNAIIIEGGGHFMIVNMAKKLSSLIQEQLGAVG
jgi:pimeloyl-ACP methyl ester carboxylesterase